MTHNLALSGELLRAAATVVTARAVDRIASLPTLACTSPGPSPGRIAERLAGSVSLTDPAFLFLTHRALNAGNGRTRPILRHRFIG